MGEKLLFEIGQRNMLLQEQHALGLVNGGCLFVGLLLEEEETPFGLLFRVASCAHFGNQSSRGNFGEFKAMCG